MTKPKIIISNGFNKFHLSIAGSEIDKRNNLYMYITGFYPFIYIENIFNLLNLQSPKILRFKSRKAKIDPTKIKSLFMSELLWFFGQWLQRKKIKVLSKIFIKSSLILYGICSSFYIYKLKSNEIGIFHCRSGFGFLAINKAKKCGWTVISDHSMAAPHIYEQLINSNGNLDLCNKNIKSKDILLNHINYDLENSSFILANSDFCKDTLIYQGFDSKKIRVIYLGLDEEFINYVNDIKKHIHKNNYSMCFVGRFTKEKGALTIIEAINKLIKSNSFNLKLTIIGEIDKDMFDSHPNFFDNKNVETTGVIGREAISKILLSTQIFVFPSQSEGSARVIYEAMACGCFIITTPNAGSVVRDKESGFVIPPNNSTKLYEAIENCFSNIDIDNVKDKNQKIIFYNYSNLSYGCNLNNFYEKLVFLSNHKSSK
tara:strand:+ start:547 stop:1830 length:1284 start_codon:yes stop_codon:yes gene_type:complete